jgi:hypothetical protein
MYIWNCHNKTPELLSQTNKNVLFSQMKRQEDKNRSCLGGGYQWERGGHKERVKEGEDSGRIFIHV